MIAESTVFLVDDDASARRSFQFLAKSAGLSVESYGSATEFLETYDPDRPGCLVLDVRMPRMSGLELQQKLVAANVRIPIIFVSGHADVPTATRAFRTGAFDFVEKPVDNQLLLERIQEAIRRDSQNREKTERAREVRSQLEKLTPREREVFEWMTQGRSVKHIAAHLEVTFQTAAKHRARVLEKMEVQNEVELLHRLELPERTSPSSA